MGNSWHVVAKQPLNLCIRFICLPKVVFFAEDVKAGIIIIVVVVVVVVVVVIIIIIFIFYH